MNKWISTGLVFTIYGVLMLIAATLSGPPGRALYAVEACENIAEPCVPGGLVTLVSLIAGPVCIIIGLVSHRFEPGKAPPVDPGYDRWLKEEIDKRKRKIHETES